MIVKEIILRQFPYKSRRGLSEMLIKRHFTRRGFEVFRGSMLLGSKHSVNYHRYPAVRRKYDRLDALLDRMLGLNAQTLRSLLPYRGLPDYFVYRSGQGICVEVKLEHEPVRKDQKAVLSVLESFGIQTRIMRVKRKVYRSLARYGDGGIEVLEKQQRIKRRYPKRAPKASP